MGDVREDVAKLFGKEEISLSLLDAPADANASVVSLEFLDKPAKADESKEGNYINMGILEKPASLMCEHLSVRVLECNVGGFAHFDCSNPAFHEKCPAKELHRKMQESRL